MDGNLGPAIPVGRDTWLWVPANLRIEADPDGMRVLAWDEVEPENLHLSKTVHDGSKLLERFIALADSPDHRILSFANRYGVLEVCEHAEPYQHGMPRRLCKPSRREHLNLWRAYARWASALLVVATDLHDGKPGTAKDWKAVEEWVGYAPPGEQFGSGKPLTPAQSRQYVATAVQTWISLGSVGLSFGWTLHRTPYHEAHKLPFRPVPQIELTGRGLLNFIARQIVVRIARGGEVAACSGCGNGFLPNRDQRKYCKPCQGSFAPRKRAKRKYKAGLRAARAKAPAAD
jgi:hypothetical protein